MALDVARPLKRHGFEHLKTILRSEEKTRKWGFYDNKTMVFPSATPEQVEKIKSIFSKNSTTIEVSRVRYHPKGSMSYYGPTNFHFYPDMPIEDFLPHYSWVGAAPAFCNAATMGQSVRHSWKEGAGHFLRVMQQFKRAGIEVKLLNSVNGAWHLWHINPPRG